MGKQPALFTKMDAVVTLVIQLRARRYNPFFYWTVILSTSMAGTTMSDFMNAARSCTPATAFPPPEPHRQGRANQTPSNLFKLVSRVFRLPAQSD
jgi:hypothetical protein